MKCLIALVLAFSSVLGSAENNRDNFQWTGISGLAIQDRGRMKPLDTFAKETVLFITGKRSWNKRPAVETLFGWLTGAVDDKVVRVDYGPLKKALGLKEDEKFFSADELGKNEALTQLLRDAAEKQKRRERLSDIEKKAQQVQNQRLVLEAVSTAAGWTILPNPQGISQPWIPLSAITHEGSLPYPPDVSHKLAESFRVLIQAYIANDASKWNSSVLPFVEIVRNELGKNGYPSASSLSREIHFNNLHPFRWAWVIYALAFILFLFHLTTKSSWSKWSALGAILIAFALHSYGFILRCLVAERPPVTNMYESVIWVTWGCVLFALVIWLQYRNATIPAASTVFAVVGLVLADNLPFVLDASINPLEPVLRSNFWLTIHVLTITLSYAAFALSLCLGNVVLLQYLLYPDRVATIQNYSLYMYRAMQIGVVLLAAGTILGGVWADYSWGRFWGWDPKEVWALIALLLYLAVLHGRFAGWLKGFGFVTCTVMSFLGVLMAWYGVNFVLGVGLHSYGFGTGGLGYVSAYVAAQLAFIAAAYFRHKKNPGNPSAPIFPKAR